MSLLTRLHSEHPLYKEEIDCNVVDVVLSYFFCILFFTPFYIYVYILILFCYRIKNPRFSTHEWWFESFKTDINQSYNYI